MKTEQKLGFADFMVEKRKIKQEFFNQVNLMVDWRLVSNIINKHYQKGNSATGRPSYDGLILFKMSLLQTWYGLSDYEVEDRVNNSISFSRFVGISLDDVVPDHSVLSRFRTEMTKKGAILDASIIDSPLKPKGQTTFQIENDRSEEDRSDEDKNNENSHHIEVTKIQKGADPEGLWIKKSGKTRFGYKKHVVTDEEGLILGILTTRANVNEISNLEDVLNSADLPEGIYLNADKGYASEKNEQILKTKKIKSRILHRARKGRPLTERQKLRNKLIGKTRFNVQRTFGSIKRCFNSTHTRYKGIIKTQTQNLIEALAHNLYRAPEIVASTIIKMTK
jgi:IS5 family transposase